MRLHIVILASAILFSSCQRKTTETVEDTNPTKQVTAADKSKSYEESKPVLIQKDLNYKESPIQSNGAMQEAMLKKKNEQTEYKSLYESGYQKHNAGDFSGAIADINKCLSLNPEFSDAYNLRGMSRYKSGDKAGACSDWKKAVELGFSQAQNMVSSYCK